MLLDRGEAVVKKLANLARRRGAANPLLTSFLITRGSAVDADGKSGRRGRTLSLTVTFASGADPVGRTVSAVVNDRGPRVPISSPAPLSPARPSPRVALLGCHQQNRECRAAEHPRQRSAPEIRSGRQPGEPGMDRFEPARGAPCVLAIA
jgi:hypothetical protein